MKLHPAVKAAVLAAAGAWSGFYAAAQQSSPPAGSGSSSQQNTNQGTVITAPGSPGTPPISPIAPPSPTGPVLPNAPIAPGSVQPSIQNLPGGVNPVNPALPGTTSTVPVPGVLTPFPQGNPANFSPTPDLRTPDQIRAAQANSQRQIRDAILQTQQFGQAPTGSITGLDVTTAPDGRFVIRGTVRTPFERQAVMTKAAEVVGVQNVVDQLTVLP